MRTRSRVIQLLQWCMVLAMLQLTAIAVPAIPSGVKNRSAPPATSSLDASAPAATASHAALEAAPPRPAPGPPGLSQGGHAMSESKQQRLMMYLILRSATGRYPFAILR